MIPVFSNSLGEEELKALSAVFASRWLGPGRQVAAFERAFADHLGAADVLMTNSATSALYLAIKCLGVKPGDEVIIPTIHFVATAGAVLAAGGVPVYCGVDPRTLNITARDVYNVRTQKTVGVIVNHYGGHVCPVDEVKAAMGALWVLEDAANAPDSRLRGVAAGALADCGVWSFDSMKPMAAGDAGALWFRDPDLLGRARTLANYGLSAYSGSSNARAGADRWWEYEVLEPWPKMLSNDMIAAVALAQLQTLRAGTERRAELWARYQKGLAGIAGLTTPPEPPRGSTSSYYLYWIQSADRDNYARYLYDHGVYTTFRYYPLELAYKELRSQAYTRAARAAAERTLNLPLHANLTNSEQDYIIAKVREAPYV